LEQVVNSVGGNHSPFAQAFIDTLNDNKNVVDMSSMYPQIRRSVLLRTEQSPVYSDIRNTEHEGGDFFFVRKKIGGLVVALNLHYLPLRCNFRFLNLKVKI